MRKVKVLMSTYNGEKYIREQLDSILTQQKIDVDIVIRDDCSSDATRDILRLYEEKYENVKLILGKENLGVTGSFFSLICNNVDSEYFALADQDDIWESDKLEVAVDMLEKYPKDIPLLYYSNLKIVDSEGNFCRNSHAVPHIGSKKYSCFVENLATGCTVVYNKKMAEIAHEVQPKNYSMHDIWLYTVAKMFGRTIYDFTPHIQYRQHGSNQVGTYQKTVSAKKILKILKITFDWKRQPKWNDARIFYEEFEKWLNSEEKEQLRCVVEYKSSIKNRMNLIKSREFRSDSVKRNIRLRLRILLGTL